MYMHTVNTCSSANIRQLSNVRTKQIVFLMERMPRKAKEFAVKWLESKDAGKINLYESGI